MNRIVLSAILLCSAWLATAAEQGSGELFAAGEGAVAAPDAGTLQGYSVDLLAEEIWRHSNLG